MKNQPLLNQYFGHEWKSRIEDRYKYSGEALVNKVLPGEFVLDVGCGNNYFKGKLNYVYGIDPANDLADEKVTIEEFNSPILFDVAFCLGSINFGNYQDIINDIDKLVKCLKPKARIYWRCNPGKHDHGTDAFNAIDVYPWSMDDHRTLSQVFGFRIQVLEWDTGDRIYAEWVR